MKILFLFKSYWWEVSLVGLAFAFLVFSYFWVDFGLVLMLTQAHPFLKNLQNLINFRDSYERIFAWTYLILIIVLTLFQILLFISKIGKNLELKYLLIIGVATTLLFSFSYPFLSHDIFTYLFSAKMVLSYHVNPYFVSPGKFMANDLWLSFMHNIQFTYAYGPLALVYSLVPMVFFGGKRFILNFFGLKLMNAIVFYLAGLLLLKTTSSKRLVFAIWFFNPFLLIEFLANAHNDLLMVALFVLFIFYLYQKKTIKGMVALISSILAKYVSLVAVPLVFLVKMERKKWPVIFKVFSLAIIIALGVQKIRGVQPWYYTWVYMFLPFANFKTRTWVIISLWGFWILLSYFPFVRTGFWGGTSLAPYSQFWPYFLVLLACFSEFGFLNLSFFRIKLDKNR